MVSTGSLCVLLLRALMLVLSTRQRRTPHLICPDEEAETIRHLVPWTYTKLSIEVFIFISFSVR